MSRNLHFIQTSFSLLKIVAQQIEKLHDLGQYIGVLVESEGAKQELDRFLWTYKQGSFIPHATDIDSDSESQPVYISNCCYFPNSPKTLVCIDCIPSEEVCEREIIAFTIASTNIDKIRAYYKLTQDLGHQVLFSKAAE